MDDGELITGAMLRKAAAHHKTNGGKCIEGVAASARGTRFLVDGEAPKADESARMFVRCPVCGKRFVEEPGDAPPA